MARRRVKATVRKAAERERSAVHEEAFKIADGVFHVARETLESTPRAQLPLPVYAFAPVSYATEMMGAVICERQGWPLERAHDVGLYLRAGVLEVAVAAFDRFDPEHFEVWMAAMEHAAANQA